MIRLAIALSLIASGVGAESLTTNRAIRPATVLVASDLTVLQSAVPGTLTSVEDVVGMETKITLYPGRPIRRSDIGPPALVDRNQLVEITYRTSTITIRTEGRALDRGAVGERVRVMNLGSRTTVTGVVSERGKIIVSPFGGSS